MEKDVKMNLTTKEKCSLNKKDIGFFIFGKMIS